MNSKLIANWIRPHENGAILSLYIQPGASRSEISGEHDGRLKLKIKAPPRDGEANENLIEFIAALLGLSKKSVHLLSGESSRQKSLLVELSVDEVLLRIKV